MFLFLLGLSLGVDLLGLGVGVVFGFFKPRLASMPIPLPCYQVFLLGKGPIILTRPQRLVETQKRLGSTVASDWG